jgi:uncharacterized protein (TIGR00255 family)
MKSMTGFGIGDALLGGGKVILEIRGVNHRFLEVRVRLPKELVEQSAFVEQLARDALTRGRYEVSARLEGAVFGTPELNRERARAAYRALCELRDELAPGAEVPLSLLATVPDLFAGAMDRGAPAAQESLAEALRKAVLALDEMRRNEGRFLRDDLARRLVVLRESTQQMRQRSPELVENQRRRLGERLERLRANLGFELEPGRLEQEMVLFAERVDIAEELTRLDSHFAQFDELLSSAPPVGRRLEFLLQEMGREANTIGSKSPDAAISHAVVALKGELERLREQIQNVE